MAPLGGDAKSLGLDIELIEHVASKLNQIFHLVSSNVVWAMVDALVTERCPMEAQFAKTFTEYAAWMASNSPHAAVLDWWRRLELTLREYAASRGLAAAARGPLEDAISQDPQLGPEIAATLRRLRRRRNAVAHEAHQLLSGDEAASYAKRAFELMGIFGKL